MQHKNIGNKKGQTDVQHLKNRKQKVFTMQWRNECAHYHKALCASNYQPVLEDIMSWKIIYVCEMVHSGCLVVVGIFSVLKY